MSDDSVNKILVGVLVFLCVAIVGLGIGIGVVNLVNMDDTSVTASEFYYALENEYKNDINMSIDDVLGRFDEKISTIKGSDFRMTFVMWRAKFVATYGDGARTAIDYLEKEAEGIIMNDETVYDYYSNLCYYYGVLEDQEKVQFYLQKMNEMKKSASVGSVEGGEYEYA